MSLFVKTLKTLILVIGSALLFNSAPAVAETSSSYGQFVCKQVLIFTPVITGERFIRFGGNTEVVPKDINSEMKALVEECKNRNHDLRWEYNTINADNQMAQALAWFPFVLGHRTEVLLDGTTVTTHRNGYRYSMVIDSSWNKILLCKKSDQE